MSVTRHYATACHAHQLTVLARSMLRHCQPFKLTVLAWDWNPDWMSGVTPPDEVLFEPETEIYVATRAEFLRRHPECERLPGSPRNANETVCAVRWMFLLDVMEDDGAPVTLIDGDQWFWSSPEPVFREIFDARCAVSPHGFAPASACLPGMTMEEHRKYGLYNGGWSYWADREAAAAMAEYANEWSYLGWRVAPDGRRFFGDQGALELIQERFGAHVIRHPGLNVAPWNVHTQQLEEREGVLHFGGRPLITYHYSSLRPGVQYANIDYEVNERQARLLYDPYLAELQRAGAR